MGRSGWTYGDISTGTGAWLTVFESAHKVPVLHTGKAGALLELRESAAFGDPSKYASYLHVVVAHVTETRHPGVYPGYAYKITPGSITEHPKAVTAA